jgi:hypothetical protein
MTSENTVGDSPWVASLTCPGHVPLLQVRSGKFTILGCSTAIFTRRKLRLSPKPIIQVVTVFLPALLVQFVSTRADLVFKDLRTDQTRCSCFRSWFVCHAAERGGWDKEGTGAMKYAYYPGCSLKGTGRAREESLLAVFRALGVELEELEDWNCW